MHSLKNSLCAISTKHLKTVNFFVWLGKCIFHNIVEFCIFISLFLYVVYMCVLYYKMFGFHNTASDAFLNLHTFKFCVVHNWQEYVPHKVKFLYSDTPDTLNTNIKGKFSSCYCRSDLCSLSLVYHMTKGYIH